MSLTLFYYTRDTYTLCIRFVFVSILKYIFYQNFNIFPIKKKNLIYLKKKRFVFLFYGWIKVYVPLMNFLVWGKWKRVASCNFHSHWDQYLKVLSKRKSVWFRYGSAYQKFEPFGFSSLSFLLYLIQYMILCTPQILINGFSSFLTTNK